MKENDKTLNEYEVHLKTTDYNVESMRCVVSYYYDRGAKNVSHAFTDEEVIKKYLGICLEADYVWILPSRFNRFKPKGKDELVK